MSTEDSDFEQSYANEVKDIVLPAWLTAEFPEHLPYQTISYDEGTFWVQVNSTAASFSTIEEAYDYAAMFKDKLQIRFDRSVDGHGGRLSDNGFFCKPSSDTGYIRLLVAISTESIVTNLKHDYLDWLTEVSVEYHSDPEDFVKAHTWLSHHPLFWIKGKEEKSFLWATDMGLDSMAINVWAHRETGKPVVFLEHGGHRPDAGYTNYYHDDRIFARGETFEEAVIEMAKKVDKVFDLDGDERTPNAEDSDD